MNYSKNLKVVIIGGGGGIGSAFVENFSKRDDVEQIFALSSKDLEFNSDKVKSHKIDVLDEKSIQNVAKNIAKDGEVDIVVEALGILRGENLEPEKSMKDLSLENFERVFKINTIAPALLMKYFLPILKKDEDEKSAFLALSARVGSIGDNRLGGWYAYRASKSALNMIIKNSAIEINRRFKNIIVAGLHPGTVDTNLSKKFQGGVAPEKLFTPEYSTAKMIEVIMDLKPENSGRVLDYKGEIIEN